MMLWQFIGLLITHWIADFICQTHWQASNKSKNNVALLRHVLVYSAIMAVPAVIFIPSPGWFGFVLVTGVLHFGTDWFTSRLSAELFANTVSDMQMTVWLAPGQSYKTTDWSKFNPHNFFVVIGFDQLIHQATLAVTLWWFLQ